jgi:hypothetical protein
LDKDVTVLSELSKLAKKEKKKKKRVIGFRDGKKIGRYIGDFIPALDIIKFYFVSFTFLSSKLEWMLPEDTVVLV